MLECKTAQASKIKTEKILKLKLFMLDQARSYNGGSYPKTEALPPSPARKHNYFMAIAFK